MDGRAGVDRAPAIALKPTNTVGFAVVRGLVCQLWDPSISLRTPNGPNSPDSPPLSPGHLHWPGLSNEVGMVGQVAGQHGRVGAGIGWRSLRLGVVVKGLVGGDVGVRVFAFCPQVREDVPGHDGGKGHRTVRMEEGGVGQSGERQDSLWWRREET